MTKLGTADSGFISGMLRLLLCKGSVPTYPSDKIIDPMAEFECSRKDLNSSETKSEAPVEPGIVARLMGLESNWVPKQRSPNTVLRSKSVNFVDYLLEFECSQAQAGAHHRRVRTSASFREVPPLLNQKKDFLVVCLSGDGDGDGDKSREKTLTVRKLEVGLGVVRQGKDHKEKSKENIKQNGAKMKTKHIQKKNKISNLKDEPRRHVRKQTSGVRKRKASNDLGTVITCYKNNDSRNVNPKQHPRKPPLTIQKEASGGSRLPKKGKNQRLAKKMDTPSDSENLSPISVLDVENLAAHYKIRFPGVFSSTEIAYSKTPGKLSNASDEPEMKATKKKDDNLVGNRESEDYADMVEKLYRLTEKDIRVSKWMTHSATEFEAICMELEDQIFHVQLLDVLDEMVSTCFFRFNAIKCLGGEE